MDEVNIGHVIDYFVKIEVAAIDITAGKIEVGDTLHFSGHTTDFSQEIDSMQIDNEKVKLAEAGESVGIKVIDRVREGDKVYKVIP
mgnify:CR=1 FL=1